MHARHVPRPPSPAVASYSGRGDHRVMTVMSPNGGFDHLQHQQEFLQRLSSWPEAMPLNHASRLLYWAVCNYASIPSDALLPTNTAGAACFARCFWQLRGALGLAELGFNAEARNLLRSAYESAGLGRILALDEAGADDWFADPKRWPHKRVRRWIDETQLIPGAAGEDYAGFYQLASAWAHPSAESCMPALSDDGTTTSPSLTITFDEDASRQAVREITLAIVFTCFAIKNALGSEQVLDPNWFKELGDLARELTGQPMEHLKRDWEKERVRFAAFMDKVHTADQAQEVLANHSRSVRNLTNPEATAEN